MSNYICMISDHLDEKGNRTKGTEIYSNLMSKNVWGLHPTTATRTKLKEGDKLVFYLGSNKQVFLGTAVVRSKPYIDKKGESDNWFLNKGTYRLDLANVMIWDKPKPIRPLLNKFSFIKNVIKWGPYLQGGIRKIDQEDYDIIENSQDYSEVIEGQDVPLELFLEKINLEAKQFEPHSLPAPERIEISELIENIEDKWKIPNFQRYFDWDKDDIKDFLESIFFDYYVGAFLLWKTEKEAPLDLISIKGVKSINKDSEYIILDGQQRMTALYYAIRNPSNFSFGNSNQRIYFYIDFKKFFEDESSRDLIVVKNENMSSQECFEKLLFPINKLSQYDEWINGLEDYLLDSGISVSVDKTRSLRRIIEKRLKHMWRGFEIPYIVLPKTMNLSQVADIFERINTKGKQLDTFDLLIARLLKYGIQLRQLWDLVLKENEDVNRYYKNTEKIKMYIFQVMSLLNHPSNSVKRKDILDIYENLSLSSTEEFNEIWAISVKAIKQAILTLENMRSGFGVRRESEIPFTSFIPILAALMHDAEKKENKPDCYSKIKMWYWSAVFTNAYSYGVDTQMSADYKDVNLWFDDDSQIPRVVLEARREVPSLDLKIVTSSGNAIYKGVMSLIALEGAYDFETNLSLDLSRNNDKDHIYPKASGSGFSKNKYIESVLNMTWLSDETNNRKRAKKPSEYVMEFIDEKYSKDEKIFKNILKTHFINEQTFEFLKSDKLDEFINSREKEIKRKILNFIGSDLDVEAIIVENPVQVLDDLEQIIRKRIDKILIGGYGEDYWKKIISSGVKQRVKEKIAQRNKRQPAEANKKMLSDYFLSFCDIMDYAEIILSNWTNFESLFGSKNEVEKHFLQIKDYRNALKHGRKMNNVERKQGEASMEWLYTILKDKQAIEPNE